ncbi:MAG: hypothetical protein KY455_12730 [Euryarchaeota archaeon]|nr:hypothetical protein [Euryarchaeota archaeon]
MFPVQARKIVFPLMIILILLAPSALAAGGQPHHAEVHKIGMFGCAFTGLKSIRGDPCKDFDANTNSVFRFPLEPGLTSLVLLVELDPSLLSTKDLGIIVIWENPPGSIPSVTGTSTLLVRFDFTGDEDWNQVDRQASMIVNLDKDHPTPQFAYATRIDVNIGLFYNGAEVPEDYVPGDGH